MKKQILILSFIVLLGGAGAWNFLKAPVDTQPPPVTSVPQTVPVHTPEASSSDEPVAAPSASAHVPNSSENPSAAEAMPAGDAPIVYIDEKPYPLRTYKPLVLPNDPSADQWWVTQTGLDKAWDIPRGSGETVLAIIDTGFGLKHEEFANRWHTNSGESGITATEDPSSLNCTGRSLPISAACNLIDDNGDSVVDNETGTAIYENPSRLNCTDQGKLLDKSCNRVDDEGNGFVDDTTGWDFINYDNSVQAGELNPTGSGTTHGTLVAGVAAATGNNAKGIAGVDWGTKIMPLQALDDDSYGDTRSVGRAINYAVKQGVDVISLSLGSDSPDPYVETAVQAATAAGILVLAASGNDGCDCISYPARYSEVIAVGALNTSSLPASFSSFGAGLDILAPGTSITTSTWSNTNPTSAYASGVSGTSFATPLAAGLATRLLSHQPTATPLQITAILKETTNRLSLGSVPRSDTLGHGTVKADTASSRMTTPYNPSLLYAFTPISKGSGSSFASHAETKSTYLTYQCPSDRVGGTLITELTKPDSSFFSLNPTEIKQAPSNGYTATNFTYLCLQQPHDKPSSVRSINLFREFRNIETKP